MQISRGATHTDAHTHRQQRLGGGKVGKAYLFLWIDIAQGDEVHRGRLALRKPILRDCVGNARVVEQPAGKRKDAVANGCEVGMDDEVVVPEASIDLVDEVLWRWRFYWYYDHSR